MGQAWNLCLLAAHADVWGTPLAWLTLCLMPLNMQWSGPTSSCWVCCSLVCCLVCPRMQRETHSSPSAQLWALAGTSPTRHHLPVMHPDV